MLATMPATAPDEMRSPLDVMPALDEFDVDVVVNVGVLLVVVDVELLFKPKECTAEEVDTEVKDVFVVSGRIVAGFSPVPGSTLLVSPSLGSAPDSGDVVLGPPGSLPCLLLGDLVSRS